MTPHQLAELIVLTSVRPEYVCEHLNTQEKRDEACCEGARMLDEELRIALARAERAESKLAAIRKLVTFDKPLIGEQPGTPRFIVKGCDVLAVLDGEGP